MTDFIASLFLNLPVFSMPQIGLNSILDIAFISYVMYKILMWIKQTRGWTLFKGVVTIAIIYVGTMLLSMNTAMWIMDQSFTIAAIGAVIIFQPELRKVLENLGKNRNIPFFAPLEENKENIAAECIEAITQATTKMSKTKTGALIIIENDVPLGDWEASGVRLDAMVTTQLLLAIFENKAPLHDGAVLLRQNRIRAAACILPLTSSRLASELGTRHRAAVGATEGSDAYALVVSEETGAISIAKDGKLFRDLSERQVKELLMANNRNKKLRAPKIRAKGKNSKDANGKNGNSNKNADSNKDSKEA